MTLGGAKPSGEPPRIAAACSIRRSCARRVPHAFRKLDPRLLARNPVMFVVEVTAVLVTVIAIVGATGIVGLEAGRASASTFQIAVWLWFTVLFANFAEAMAEARGQGPGRDPARDPDGDQAHRRAGTARWRRSAASDLRRATWCWSARAR